MEVYERVAQEDHRYLRITIFKYGRYSYRSDTFIQHMRFDLLLENSW